MPHQITVNPTITDSQAQRNATISRIVERVRDRRGAGEVVRDAQVVAEHPDLAPELSEQLRLLGVLERVRSTPGRSNVTGLESVRRGAEASTIAGTPWRGEAPAEVSLPRFPGYTTIRCVDRGGQGVVYEGIQDGTQRRVAIKLMRDAVLGIGPKENARFEREVRILGRLDHPNIVGILGSGIANSHAYLVMEYVDGTPLDQFVDAADLPVPERVALIRRVCAAVSAAHMKGVIHRDLKPSNVHVTDDGEPHVLDFGLAGLTDEFGGGQSMAHSLTQTGQFLGTLIWASPEQADGKSASVDVRTDVYALGLLLFEALTGAMPYRMEGSTNAMVRSIVDAPPARPSSLRRGIDTDLDTIVLKCLAKEPGARYQSAAALTEELGRFLEGSAISARPMSLTYRVRTFTRRNRALVTGAGAVISALALGLLVAIVLLVEARTQRRRADERAHMAATAEAAAEASRKETGFQLYVATISAAQAAIASDDTRTAIEQLRASPMYLRGWEWRHLAGQANQSCASRRLAEKGGWTGGVWDFSVSADESTIAATVNEKVCLLDSTTLRVLKEVSTAPDHTIVSFGGPGQLIISGNDRARVIELGNHLGGTRDRATLFPLFCHPVAGVGAILYDPGTAREVRRIEEPAIRCGRLSPDGRLIAILTSAGWIDIRSIEPDGLMASHKLTGPGYQSVVWSPDGSAIAAVNHYAPVLVWNIHTDRVIAEINLAGAGTGVCFSPDGQELAIGLLGGRIARWDLDSGRVKQVLSGAAANASVLEYSRDGSVLWAGADDASVYRFDLASNACPSAVPLIAHSVQAIIGDSRDFRAIVCTTKGAIHAIRLASGEIVQSLSIPGEIDRGVVATADGRVIVAAHSTIGSRRMSLRRWDVDTGIVTKFAEQALSMGGGRAVMHLASDGSAVALRVEADDGQTSVVIDPQSGRIIRGPDAKPRFVIQGFGPGGEIVGNAPDDHSCRIYSGVAALLEGEYHELPTDTVPDQPRPHIMAVSRDFVVGATDPRLFIWDKATGSRIATVPGTLSEVLGLAIMPDQLRFVMMCEDGVVRIHELPSGRRVAALRGAAPWSFGRLSPDGEVWVTAGPDHTVRFWEAPIDAALPQPWSAVGNVVDALEGQRARTPNGVGRQP